MSVRENIADNIKTVIDAISSPDVKLCTRQPFELEELSQSTPTHIKIISQHAV